MQTANVPIRECYKFFVWSSRIFVFVKNLKALEILDSRGNPTVRVFVEKY
jgi:hypothetical protein